MTNPTKTYCAGNFYKMSQIFEKSFWKHSKLCPTLKKKISKRNLYFLFKHSYIIFYFFLQR